VSDPIVIISVLCAPLCLVVLWLLWRGGANVHEDHWYALPRMSPSAAPKDTWSQVRPVSAASPPDREHDDIKSDLLKVCERALFCWDYWSAGKSGVNLQDVFEVRNVPSQLRDAVSKAKNAT